MAHEVVINEVMASNADIISDEDGSFEDWIELYNAGEEAINLYGYGLSDDLDDVFKWVFPDYTLQPGEYLLVWASGKDRKPSDAEWYNGIKRRFYPGIPGTSVNDLINHPSFPNNPATRSVIAGAFEAPTDIADNYGQHMFCWLLAPESGYYRFNIASDDNSQLFLSTDHSPENAVLIAGVPGWTFPRQWDKYNEQLSQEVFLEAGNAYYFSALMKEGMGGDNLAVRWQLPDGTIEEPLSAAHCYLFGAAMHTNFRLSSDGEPLLLTHPDGTILDEMPAVPIPRNVSYGRMEGNTTDWFYFAEPTPGEPNSSMGFAGLSPQPVIFPAPGIYAQPVSVSLITSDPEAQIFFTLDGTEPSANNGILYQEPFVIAGSRLVRSVAYSSGYMQSALQAASYTVINTNIRDFESDLPIMVIHELGNPITAGNRSKAYMGLYDTNDQGRTILTDDPVFHGKIDINRRGSSSLHFPKNNFGFHLLNEDKSNNKVSLLDMPEEHNWVLHGPYSDKTLMRNAFSYELGRATGHYSPRTRFIELFIHTDHEPLTHDHYHGVYVLTERIKIAPGRVEIEDTELHHNSYPEVSGGYIYSYDRLNDDEAGFLTQRGNQFRFVRPNEHSITFQQRNYLVSYIDSLETALFGDDFADPHQGYSRYLDKLSFIDVHLITELLKEIDGYRLSSFFYKDRGGKLISGPLWDFNLSLGNANYHQGWLPQGWYYSVLSQRDYLYGWYTRLFMDEAFEQAYYRRYQSLRLTAFSQLNLMRRIDEMREELTESQERNFERWDILGEWIWPNWFVGNTWESEVEWMANWLKQRIYWMDSQLGEPLTMLHYWNFNETHYTEPTYSIHSADFSVQGAAVIESAPETGQGFSALNARNGDSEGSHLRVNNPAGTELIFHVSTLNYQKALFSYEARRSANGANRHFISYATDGETFIPFDTIRIEEKVGWFTVDFASIEEVDNNPDFTIKISMYFDMQDNGGAEGNNRFDNISLDAEAMPGTIRPPVELALFPRHFEIAEGQESLIIDLGKYFSHPDNVSMDFSPGVIKSAGKADISVVDDDQLYITPLERGGTIATLVISDGVNPPINKEFYILVYPEAFTLSQESYIFDFWSPHEPEGSFPPNMLFVQSEESDPQITTDLVHAYAIPVDDYAGDDQNNIGFPYRNQSRTRINGLNANGVSFINTGRGRDLGAAVLALDTREVSGFLMSWKASTVRINSRMYALRLQYRTGLNKSWKDWANANGGVYEYSRGEFAGHSRDFQIVHLLPSMIDQPYLQLRWLYYDTGVQTNPDSGARDMLALNRIAINDGVFVDNLLVNIEPLKAYPNPNSSGVFHTNKMVWGDVFDLQGRKVHSVAGKTILNLSPLRDGIYILRTAEGETIRLSILKNQ